MMVEHRTKSRWRRWAAWLAAGLLIVVLAASFLPLVEANAWWVRYTDFPRLQFAISLVLLMAGFVILQGRLGKLGWILTALTALALGYHASRLYPYTPLSAPAAVAVDSCPDGGELTLMIANVKERNEYADEFLQLVSEVEPDLLLVMETDPWWDRHLAPLDESYPEREQFIPEGHGAFGMHVFSKLKLVSPEFRFFFDAYTPSLFTSLELRDGSIVRFLGLHPHPPIAFRQPTTLRDAHLLTAALEARSAEAATIMAGDLNAVPWEAVTRRAIRIGRLLDPRVGRGLYPTFETGSLLISWPLDHVLYQESFGLLDYEKLRDFGSDHFPIMARLCHAPDAALPQTAPEPESDDLEEAETSIRAARALEPERPE